MSPSASPQPPVPPTLPTQLGQAVRVHPFPLVFVTLGGPHLYGFASVNTRFELRGVHVLTLREALGLEQARDTLEFSHLPQPTRLVVPLSAAPELNLLTHDLRKFAALLLGPGGYALEQVLSPLVVYTTPAHSALRDLARQGVTRTHGQHYLSASVNQWRRLELEAAAQKPLRIGALLAMFRTVLSGIHLMQTGELETNLVTLNAAAHLPYITDLLSMKTDGLEEESLSRSLDLFRPEHQRLLAQLAEDLQSTTLPSEAPPHLRAALSEWVVDTRLMLNKEQRKRL